MNATGCPSLYAYDNVFSREPVSNECELLIPLFVVVLEYCACVHLVVALKRTQIIRRNRNKRQERTRQGVAISKWSMAIPYITLCHSWGSFGGCALAPLVWYLYSPSGFMLAIVGFCFNLQCELWLAKLIRLGSRIIPVTSVSSLQSSSGTGDSSQAESNVILDQLSKTDRPLKVMQALSRSLLIAQFLAGAIAFPLVPSHEDFLVRFLVGIEAPLGVVYAASLIWQYLRCEHAIQRTNDVTKKMLSGQESSTNATLSAIKKMRQQRYILAAAMGIGCTLALLFAVNVIVIRYWLLLTAEVLDSSISMTMAISLFRKGRHRNRKTVDNSKNIQMMKGPTPSTLITASTIGNVPAGGAGE
jgi:hypothetical protein